MASQVEVPAVSLLWLWLLLCGIGSIPGPEMPTYCLCGKNKNQNTRMEPEINVATLIKEVCVVFFFLISKWFEAVHPEARLASAFTSTSSWCGRQNAWLPRWQCPLPGSPPLPALCLLVGIN